MKNYRFINYLQDKKTYWKVRRSLNISANKRAATGNAAKSFIGEQGIQFQLLWHSFRGMPYQLLAAFVFISAIELLSWLLRDFFGWLLTVTQEDEDTLVQLLTALVTVLGVVLGLYFTALGAVAGNLFVRAPASLQRLFLNDRKGRQYIQTLVLATLIGIFYLLYMSAGYQPSILGPVGLVIVCAYVVMRFMTIGSQAFYFIHPVEASAKLQGDLQEAIKNVTFHRGAAKRALIQARSQSKAARALKTFDKLVDFGIDPVKLSGQQLFAIANYLGYSLQYYITTRSKIPTDSAWFTTKNVHQKWLLSEGGNLIAALNTGTGLRPNSVRHMDWFEETALRTIFKVLRHLITTKDWSSAQACIEILVGLAERSGQYMSKTTTSLIVDKATDEIISSLDSIDTTELADEDIEGVLSLYEGLGRLPTAALLGMLKVIHSLSIEQLIAKLDSIRWGRSGNFYSHSLPTPIIAELEKIQNHLDNEKPIEGKIVSPAWYLRTLTLHHYLAAIKSYYEQVKSYDNTYRQQTKRLSEIEGYQTIPTLAAACVSSCSMEYASKLIDLGQHTSRLIEEAKPYHGFKDLKWAEIDDAKEKTAIINIYNGSIDRMTRLIGPLLVLPKESRDGFPDYLGQAIVFGMNAVYDAVRQNNTSRLKEVFTPVLMGAITSREYLQEDVKGWLQESQITIVTEPLEDILALSGFIKIYSELHDNPELWEVCTKTWDELLGSGAVDAVKLVTMLAATMSYRDSIFAITPRANIRTGWDMQLRRSLEDAGVSTELNPDPFGREDAIPTHPSPLVRLVARGAGMLDSDARTIFLSLYLSQLEAIQGQNIEFPDRREFNRMYDAEIHRYDSNDADGEEDE